MSETIIVDTDVGRKYIGMDGCIYEIVNYDADRQFPFTSLKVGNDDDYCGVMDNGHAVLNSHKFSKWFDETSIITLADIGRLFKTKKGWIYKVRQIGSDLIPHPVIVEDVFDLGCYSVSTDGRFYGGDESVAFLNWLAPDDKLQDDRKDGDTADGSLITVDFDYHKLKERSSDLKDTPQTFAEVLMNIDLSKIKPVDFKPRENEMIFKTEITKTHTVDFLDTTKAKAFFCGNAQDINLHKYDKLEDVTIDLINAFETASPKLEYAEDCIFDDKYTVTLHFENFNIAFDCIDYDSEVMVFSNKNSTWSFDKLGEIKINIAISHSIQVK